MRIASMLILASLLVPSFASAADWYLRVSDESAEVGTTVTTFYVDGSAHMLARDPDGNEVADEKQQLPDDRLRQLRDLSYASQAGEWKSERLCPEGEECSYAGKTVVETRLRNGRAQSIIEVDGRSAIARYRDNPAVIELRRLMTEDPEGRSLFVSAALMLLR